MSTFMLQIITPEKVFFEGEVQRVIVRTTEGDVGILAKHEKYVAALPSGPVRITLENGKERLAALSGGAVKVSPSQTAILANAVEWAEDSRSFLLFRILRCRQRKSVSHMRSVRRR